MSFQTDKPDRIDHIIKRTGESVIFDRARIFRAVEKAFLATNTVDPSSVESVTQAVVDQVPVTNRVVSVESVQDTVELVLISKQFAAVAKNFILYREKHKQAREKRVLQAIQDKQLVITHPDNQTSIYDPLTIKHDLNRLGMGLNHIDTHWLLDSINRTIYPRIPVHEVTKLLLNTARDNIERHYDYDTLSARIVLDKLYNHCLGTGFNTASVDTAYRSQFSAYIAHGIDQSMLNAKLGDFDLDRLASALVPDRDRYFNYLGIQILSDRYLIQDRDKSRGIYELPQWFWMRVAMGLALKELDPTARAIEFYTVLSELYLVSSTPTLFNSGTNHSQMSSCYLNTVDDSLTHIFKVYADNAQLSKWAGGIGTDWTNIRATGSIINGTNGASQGVIPFIKIFNDVALAVNQGGRRRGAMCAYMEIWHADFEQFLELKKNTGDERRRTHDINTACWIPDLFMKRLLANEMWTFFCPADVPDLHDLYGTAFEDQYKAYELQPDLIRRQMPASDLWRKMITMLYETGHPWITFKDPINLRNPQDHVGVIHSSNLCTEITLNTNLDETAVCNLASINLARFITESGDLDESNLSQVIKTGVRMLDNVIDNNYYPTKEAETSNRSHRAIGLGLMGYQDALYQLNLPFDSDEAVAFADRSMELISYHAILASSELAKERGVYPTYAGSQWDKAQLPYDTLNRVDNHRGVALDVARCMQLDWGPVRAHIKAHGMRNSNIMAIAPTATIANISGVYPCTEPAYKNMYMKENLSGNFIVINKYLIRALQASGLWTPSILNRIKLNNGSIQHIDEIPESIRSVFKEVFEVDSLWLLKAAARRMKWIDQACSTNIFTTTKSGRALGEIYLAAWRFGLKTTYYLRTLGASQVEKATTNTTAYSTSAISDADCEACQ